MVTEQTHTCSCWAPSLFQGRSPILRFELVRVLVDPLLDVHTELIDILAQPFHRLFGVLPQLLQLPVWLLLEAPIQNLHKLVLIHPHIDLFLVILVRPLVRCRHRVCRVHCVIVLDSFRLHVLG
eukprot:TRINITY_DN44941_c0_g1_i1.p1 TRINITY_DN44941_c0_g1~~TRINITY_DN44941_c0_g1_i1.p1  ORF type:complete len:124 (-),score=1.51 TRINITY_DN44941_c0_g1_i1:183-554(-)